MVSKCISIWGEFSEHEYTGDNATCDYCGQVSEMIAVDQLPTMRAALVAIQELHKPVYEGDEAVGCWRCDWEQDGQWPCRTRRLADDALETN